MNRRSWLVLAVVGAGLAATGCSGKSMPSSVSVSQQKLQEMVSSRFPRQFPVAGLLHLNLSAPQLLMVPERNAINAPIQGTAADIIKVAMVRIFNRFKKENIRSKMILQVHDELNFSVYPDEKEQVEKIVMEEMQGAYQMKVSLTADAGWGKNWLEAH